MNREIKFRAWDKLRKGMVPVTGLVWDNRGLALDTFDYRDTDQWERSGDYTLMQYTGLSDKNGVEIYEGDVLRYQQVQMPDEQGIVLDTIWYTNARVEWDGVDGCWVIKHQRCEGRPEVIGNIYEHPHLLAGDKESA